MQLLDEYFEIQKKIHDYFGSGRRDQNPIDDCREYFWRIDGSTVTFAETENELETEDGQCFSSSMWDRGEFRRPDFTMIYSNDGCGNGSALMVFDNSKERPNAH